MAHLISTKLLKKMIVCVISYIHVLLYQFRNTVGYRIFNRKEIKYETMQILKLSDFVIACKTFDGFISQQT